MRVGLMVLELYLPGCHSLKQKRKVVRSLKDRVCAKHNVAAAEVDFQDLHQRARLAFVTVASDEQPVNGVFDKILEAAESAVPGGVRETEREVMH